MMSSKKLKLLIANVKDIMGTRDLLKWILENNPDNDANKIIWEGISNAVWFAYHTEPICISDSEMKQVLDKAQEFKIRLPNPTMEIMLKLNEQLSANDINIGTILELQKQLDHAA